MFGAGLRRRFSFAAAVLLLASSATPGLAAQSPEVASEAVRVIVTFDGPPDRAAEQAIERAGGTVRGRLALVDGLAAELPAAALKGLAAAGGVRSVERDVRLTAFDHGADTGDHEYENAWGVEHIGAPAVHAAGVRGQGVRVAIIDTGIDYIHDDPDNSPYVVDPEFLGNYAGGYDFANNDADPYDDNGHGTHVAGILAAEKNGYLVAGVAPEVDLFALKILDANGEGDVSNLILALQWALDNDIDVVNMSLGTHEISPALATAVSAAHAQGLLMVAASGNVNPLNWQELLYGCPVAFPGAYPEVLSTTFTNGNNALTGYSCTGPEVDFAAPGDQVFSTVPIGSCMFCTPQGYSAQSGTSMASPHLAGTVALLLSQGLADAGDPGLLDDVRDRLCDSADLGFGVNSTPIPSTDPRYPKYFGCGVIDADGAVLSGGPPPPPPPNQPPDAVDDAATTTEGVAVSIPVLANDSDPDGDALSVSAVGDPANGTAILDPSGTAIQYTPDAAFSGSDAFGYTISDGEGGTDSATVTLTVTAVDDPPSAVAASATTTSPDPVTVNLAGTDPDTCDLTFQVVDLPDHGGVGSLVNVACTPGSPNADGATVVYTPAAGYSGPDSFTYRVQDGTTASAPATVSITVQPAPPPPPPPPPPPEVHVGDLDGATSAKGPNWTARVTIRIESGSHAAVGGAVVTGAWSDGASGTASCTTKGNGTCAVQSPKLAAGVPSVTFTVTSVTAAGLTYAPGSNHDPDGSSTGTSITILRSG
ncbi:MAG TPA: S8 family serine peptidase [Candidatus Limnocylindrales bacterium]|nr:S8 family serine peptidase [Candidatus Limnocylindrales bacterium]